MTADLADHRESLAGRVAHFELAPLTLSEAPEVPPDRHWLRGGFPDSLLAASDAASLRWRQKFIRTYLEREVFQFAPRAARRHRDAAPSVADAGAPPWWAAQRHAVRAQPGH